MGQYISNVTRAAEVCSEYLCQSNGRCVRRDPRASHFLHLSHTSYRISSNRDGTFNVTGKHSQKELQLLNKRFQCHCYEGYEGEHCDSIEPTERTEDEMQADRHEEGFESSAECLGNTNLLIVLLLLFTFSCL